VHSYFCSINATEAERRISLVLFLFFPFSVPLILRCMNTFGLVYPLSCVIHPQLEPQSHSFENYVLVSNPVRIGVSVCVCGSTCAYTNPLAPRTDGARLELRGQAAVVALTLSRRDSSTNSRGPCQKTTALKNCLMHCCCLLLDLLCARAFYRASIRTNHPSITE